MKCYRIRDWDEHFENCESRRYKNLNWIPFPNRHDGKRFRRIMRHEKAADIFAAWCLIVQVASRCSPRGWLVDRDGALSSIDLSDATGLPQRCFRLAFDILSSPEIAWLERVEYNLPQTCGRPAADMPAIQNRPEQTYTDNGRSKESPGDKDHKIHISEKDYKNYEPEAVGSYEDIAAIEDPIHAAISVTQERNQKSWGFWVKVLNHAKKNHMNGQAERLFRGCLNEVFGEMRQGEIRKPGAVFNNKLKRAFSIQ